MTEILHKKKIEILTVCTGNICRSPMAEGILRFIYQLNPSIAVSSAGTHALAGNPAAEFAALAAKEKGIDIAEHSARLLDNEMINCSDLILCMEPSHAERVISLDSSAYKKVFNLADFSGAVRNWSIIADPYGCSLREYRVCFDEINTCIHNFIVSSRKEILFASKIIKEEI